MNWRARQAGRPPQAQSLTLLCHCPQASYKQKTLQRPKKARDITEEQKQEIKEAFDLFDTDGSGNID